MNRQPKISHVERTAFTKLDAWKNDIRRKPLIIQGARQVGKTWLIKEFGARRYENVAYINFEANPRMDSLFSSDLNFERLRTGLQIEADTAIGPGNTLIVFDEIQENGRALTALKYLAEASPEYHVIAAGSLLGISVHENVSFPVGKVDFLQLHPLTFHEFLRGTGHGRLAELLATDDPETIEMFRDQLVELVRLHMSIGGMPEAVTAFHEFRDLRQVRSIQDALINAYEQDFSKHAPPFAVPRIREIWRSIPAQLAREQRKFVYGLVRKGARAREYENALQWLHDAGLVHRVSRITKPDLPVAAYRDPRAFKLFMHDTGLLAAHAGLPIATILEGDTLFTEFKGALTEQYVFQELLPIDRSTIGYWSGERSQAEVDFVLQLGNSVYPLEVKASENLQAKSLRVYNERFKPVRCLRTSLSPWREESWMTNVPLFLVSEIARLIEGNRLV